VALAALIAVLSRGNFNQQLRRLLFYEDKLTAPVFAYNFVKVHKKHNQTPAQAAGLATDPWTFEKLLMLAD
jgi:hypothetical protein